MRTADTHLPQAAVNAKLNALLVSGAIFLALFLSGFVLFEPAPYDLFMLGIIGLAAAAGLRISRYIAPLPLLLSLLVVGGMISMLQLRDLQGTPVYVGVTFFLSLTAIFFAAALEARPGLFRIMFLGWIAGALGTAALGVAGYFGMVPGSLTFTLYGRAAGFFKDPNVFGPYLVPPAIYLLHRLLTGNPLRMPLQAGAFLFLCLAILLSFSRGAWGLMAFSALLLTVALFIASPSGLFRLRIMVMSLLGAAVLLAAGFVAIQTPAIAELFSERAQLVQEYDAARLGRFARFVIGFEMAMENPLGIGPLLFGQMLGEDTHNIWLKTLLDYSWLGFGAYLTLIVWTLAGGFRILFRDRPWQPFLLCAYVTFLGHVLLGTVIDTNHWRHFYVLLGMIWAAMALEVRHQRRAPLPA